MDSGSVIRTYIYDSPCTIELNEIVAWSLHVISVKVKKKVIFSTVKVPKNQVKYEERLYARVIQLCNFITLNYYPLFFTL